MNENSYADRLKTWHTLVANMEPRLATMSDIQASHAELKALVAELQGLFESIEAERGSLRIKTRRLREAFLAGSRARNRCVDYLKAAHGADSPEAATYGIKPRGPRKRTNKDKDVKNEAAEVSVAA